MIIKDHDDAGDYYVPSYSVVPSAYEKGDRVITVEPLETDGVSRSPGRRRFVISQQDKHSYVDMMLEPDELEELILVLMAVRKSVQEYVHDSN